VRWCNEDTVAGHNGELVTTNLCPGCLLIGLVMKCTSTRQRSKQQIMNNMLELDDPVPLCAGCTRGRERASALVQSCEKYSPLNCVHCRVVHPYDVKHLHKYETQLSNECSRSGGTSDDDGSCARNVLIQPQCDPV
jgi:hypothetical protein